MSNHRNTWADVTASPLTMTGSNNAAPSLHLSGDLNLAVTQRPTKPQEINDSNVYEALDHHRTLYVPVEMTGAGLLSYFLDNLATYLRSSFIFKYPPFCVISFPLFLISYIYFLLLCTLLQSFLRTRLRVSTPSGKRESGNIR